ncbi:MAG TPA: MBL fold metallo-hydrolase [bacterium]|nr:MBL fold metallo-hydrolase [bacterium]
MSGIKIATLCCNNVMTSAGLLAEHGQSFLVETPDASILFDVGQTDVALRNAAKMGKDLSKTDFVVLSHGHYDHAGGLLALLDVAKSFKLVVHPDAFAEKLAMTPNGMMPIGISKEIVDKLAAAGVERIETTEPFEVAPGVSTTGEVPSANDFEKIEPMLMVRGADGAPAPDPLRDDLSLIVKSEKKSALLLGCAHRGIISHIERAAAVSGVEKFDAVVGGMHLERAAQPQIDATVAALKKYGVSSIVPSHCTGPRATAALMAAFPNSALPNFVAYSFSV